MNTQNFKTLFYIPEELKEIERSKILYIPIPTK